MPVLIPVTPDGERIVSVRVGELSLLFRTCFARGPQDHWLLSIADEAEKPLISGIPLVPGIDNALKGAGDALKGHQLHVVLTAGTGREMEAPGGALLLLWFTPGEENPFTAEDPMSMLGKNLWAEI